METEGLKFGEKKFVIVLFLDLVNFTTFSDGKDPEEIDDMLNLYFSFFADILEKYGGWIEKFIGDAILAVFGKEVSSKDDPFKACLAALEIKDSLDSINGKTGLGINIRIGIHCGDIALSRRGRYDVIVGDTVNTASRIQSAAENGSIYISYEMAVLIRSLFDIKEKGEFSVKGKQKPLNLYELRGKKVDTVSIPDKNILWKRKESDDVLKLFLKEEYIVPIQGYEKSGKTFFLYYCYYLFSELLNEYTFVFYNNTVFEDNALSFLYKISETFHLEYEDLRDREYSFFEVLSFLKNCVLLIDQIDLFPEKWQNDLQTKELWEICEKNNIWLIFTSGKKYLATTIFLNRLEHYEIIHFLDFYCETALPLSVEEKIADSSQGNIWLVKEMADSYFRQGIPGTTLSIEVILGYTLDQLTDKDRDILNILSFSLSFLILNQITQLLNGLKTYNSMTEEEVETILKKLIEKNLVDYNKPFYIISNNLLKEVVKKRVLKKNKNILVLKLMEIDNDIENLIDYSIVAEQPVPEGYFRKLKEKNSVNKGKIITIINNISEYSSRELIEKENYLKKLFFYFDTLEDFILYFPKIKNKEDISFAHPVFRSCYSFFEKNIWEDQYKSIDSMELIKNMIHDPLEFDRQIYILSKLDDAGLDEKLRKRIRLFGEISKARHGVFVDMKKLEEDLGKGELSHYDFFFFHLLKIMVMIAFSKNIEYSPLFQSLFYLEKISKDIDLKLFYELYSILLVYIVYLTFDTSRYYLIKEIDKNIVFLKNQLDLIHEMRYLWSDMENTGTKTSEELPEINKENNKPGGVHRIFPLPFFVQPCFYYASLMKKFSAQVNERDKLYSIGTQFFLDYQQYLVQTEKLYENSVLFHQDDKYLIQKFNSQLKKIIFRLNQKLDNENKQDDV